MRTEALLVDQTRSEAAIIILTLKCLQPISLFFTLMILVGCSTPQSTTETATNSPNLSESKDKTVSETTKSPTSEEIVSALIKSHGIADVDQLPRFSRDQEISALVEEQLKSGEERALAVTYLLMLLKHDYAANREKLIAAVDRCKYNISTSECDYAIEYTGHLLLDGDEAFLEPLLKLAPYSDGFISENIFSFLGYTLQKNPRLYLRSLARRPRGQQRKLANQTVRMDGGGMGDEMLHDVRKKLCHLMAQRSNPYRHVARMCLEEIEAANKATRAQQ